MGGGSRLLARSMRRSGSLSDADLLGDLGRSSVVNPPSSSSLDVDGGAVDAFYGERIAFSGLGLRPGLVRNLDDLGLSHSTAIQARAAPPILAGGDVIIAAETGSGKTLSYMLPLMERILRLKDAESGVAPLVPATAGDTAPLGGLEALTLPALKDRCRERGLKVSGTKVELKARLADAGDSGEGGAAPAQQQLAPEALAEAAAAAPDPSASYMESYPRVLVLAPTRELVAQVLAMSAPVAQGLGLTVGAARPGAG